MDTTLRADESESVRHQPVSSDSVGGQYANKPLFRIHSQGRGVYLIAYHSSALVLP